MLRALPLLLFLASGMLTAPVAGMAQGSRGGEPVFVVHRQPAIPLVSLRLSWLVNDPPGLAGAGHLLQHIQYPTLQRRAHQVGAKVHIERTSDAIVYTVTGPTAELPFLASLLRSTLQPVSAGAGARLGAERDLTDERLAEWETAGRHLRSSIRVHLFPGDLSAAGTARSARRLSDHPLEELWARLYRPDRLVILAVGDVSLPDLRREFSDLPVAPEPPESVVSADTASLAPLAPAQATRGWFGVGYPLNDPDPAAVSVTARLLGSLLSEQLPGSESAGEHWWTHHGQALVLVTAVPPELLAVAPARVRGAAERLAEDLSDERVVDAARALRHDMLFYSRTPDRMAEVVGQFIDRGGEADAAQRFYADLAGVGVEDVREVLDSLDDAAAVVVEIPPQELRTSR